MEVSKGMFIRKHRVRSMLRKRLHLSDEALNKMLSEEFGLARYADAETIKKSLLKIYRNYER